MMAETLIGKGQVVRVAACRLAVGGTRWRYAELHATQIARHWQEACARNPAYFNGVIQILTGHSISGGELTAAFAITDFASFIYWRNQGHPDKTVRDCFGCAILRSAEGHLLLGLQAAGNLNSGRAYCPGGFIDQADVRADGTIDIDGSVAREIGEETGLDVAHLTRTPGYTVVAAEASIAIGIEFRSHLAAEDLRAQILRHLAGETEPELADILIVRSSRDLDGVRTTAYVPLLARAIL
jgi:hypothetical protein